MINIQPRVVITGFFHTIFLLHPSILGVGFGTHKSRSCLIFYMTILP